MFLKVLFASYSAFSMSDDDVKWVFVRFLIWVLLWSILFLFGFCLIIYFCSDGFFLEQFHGFAFE